MSVEASISQILRDAAEHVDGTSSEPLTLETSELIAAALDLYVARSVHDAAKAIRTFSSYHIPADAARAESLADGLLAVLRDHKEES